ncbi:MAG: bifunctional sulfate adenylyltransferase/adenylylsulfate kinase [Pseudomonadota bacterium]
MWAQNNQFAESLIVHFRRAEALRQNAIEYPSIGLEKRQLCDLELLLNRSFYPLEGYLSQNDYESVLENMRLADGTLWPIPICLDLPAKPAESLKAGDHLALRDQEGFLLAILHVDNIWKPDKKREALKVLGTDDPDRHPGVRALYAAGEYYVGGAVEGISLPLHYDFKDLRLPPSEVHRRFSENGWRRVIGFHTEEPLHCAHKEMTQAAAREAGAGIFLQPVVGLTQPGDVDHYTHVRCYQQIVKKYPNNMIMLGLLPLAQRLAGPREALWQALIKRNYGCSHFMAAEDQGDPFANDASDHRFYPAGEAQALVRRHEGETGIKMVPIKKMVYVEDKAQYIPADEVTAGMNAKQIASTELRRRLEFGLEIPEWFSFPEIVQELRWAYPPRSKKGFTIFFTGLSGSGKSTIAKVLLTRFMEMRDRPVTLLDGDVVRRNLSSELSFSKEHRNLNITRIGFVASEITKNKGVAICAPIAPYEESRKQNRALIGRCGGYVEVYISTPLEVCEQRDRKGLYAKARAGLVKGVTGIDDPYEVPVNPELVIDAGQMTPQEAAQEIFIYLEEQGYLK